jgi:uncharacterized repeat protein (TIGR01451 family)
MSLVLRLGALLATLLLGQQAMAVGTRADTDINNTVDVDYQVGGIDQTTLSDTVTFKVDRRVDFTLEPVSTPDLEPVGPGQNDVFVDFLLTNLSNSDLDFTLALAQMTGGSVDGSGTDDADMTNIEYAVVTAGDPTPTQGGAQYVDDLAADASVRIRVWGDAALALTNGQIAGIELTATAVELAGTEVAPGAALAYGVANGDLTVENVDPDDADGVRVSNDGFIVQSAELTVSKAYTIQGGDFGSGLPIPGATVEYTITINNASTTASADNVVITDTLDTDLVFLPDQFAGDDMTLNGTGCTEDAGDDECERSGQDLTFNVASIPVSGSLVVVYRVTILDPATTP